MNNWIALLAVAALAGCDAAAAPAPTMSAALAPAAPVSVPSPALVRDTAALAARGLGASSLPAIQLLATEAGRDTLSNVVSCALPLGASITTIGRDGTPYTFSGRHGLAPGWAAHPANPTERNRVAGCVQTQLSHRS